MEELLPLTDVISPSRHSALSSGFCARILSRQDFEFAPDQGKTLAECNFGFDLQSREGASIDAKGAGHGRKFATDQSFAEVQDRWAIFLMINST